MLPPPPPRTTQVVPSREEISISASARAVRNVSRVGAARRTSLRLCPTDVHGEQ